MKTGDPAVDVVLCRINGVPFYNTSKLDFAKLKADPNQVAENLRGYLYQYKPLRPLAVIEGEIRELEKEIHVLLGEVLG